MFNWITIQISKLVLIITKSMGGGSALPGLVMEKINPNFAKNILEKLPKGIVIVSGTNGKTSTTKTLVKILQDQNLKVFTNKSGSNFLRGVISSIISSLDNKGNLNFDIAVLELDEAHAVHFVKQIKPTYSLLLNVMRDQLDRFGEIDNVAKMLKTVALNTQNTVIINREDSHLMSFATELKNVKYYGYSDTIKSFFKTLDDDVLTNKPNTSATLLKSQNTNATIKLYDETFSIKFKIKGIYNYFNATGAALTANEILKDKLNVSKLTQSLSEIEPAFGRGEHFQINNSDIELILVKNPSGFQMSLNSLANENSLVMIAINDNYADGRDVSWLWDVDFSRLPKNIFATTGSRSKEIQNRLKYSDINVQYSNSDLEKSIQNFIEKPNENKQIYATYTAMIKIRQQLLKLSKRGNNGRFN